MSAPRITVVGAGLFGLAAARHLAERGATVQLVGPRTGDPGGESSHDDQGRVFRTLGKDAVWTKLHRRTLVGLRALQASTGIRVLRERGALVVADQPGHAYFRALEDQGVQRSNMDARSLGYHLPNVADSLFEPGPAGILELPPLMRAQHMAFAAAGGTWIRGRAEAIDGGRVKVDGRWIEGDQVLVCTGAVTPLTGLLPRTPRMRVESECVLLAEVEPGVGDALPSLLWEVDAPDYEGVYLVGPLVYPDGRTWVKLGANLSMDRTFEDLAQVREWFAGDAHHDALEPLSAALEALLPDLSPGERRTKPCIICRTATGRPYLGPVDDHTWLLTGGCGYGAMSSDGLGSMAASVLLDGDWGDLEPEQLAITWA